MVDRRAARILIVEDEVIVAEHMRMILEQSGYVVQQTVGTGEAAIHEVSRSRPDLVLMDIRLGGKMDGIEAAVRIGSLSHVPVVFLTAHTDQSTLEKTRAASPIGYVFKPFSEADLQSAVDAALARIGRWTGG
jgi:CheY-like chemotaxis protein